MKNRDLRVLRQKLNSAIDMATNMRFKLKDLGILQDIKELKKIGEMVDKINKKLSSENHLCGNCGAMNKTDENGHCDNCLEDYWIHLEDLREDVEWKTLMYVAKACENLNLTIGSMRRRLENPDSTVGDS